LSKETKLVDKDLAIYSSPRLFVNPFKKQGQAVRTKPESKADFKALIAMVEKINKNNLVREKMIFNYEHK